MNESLMILKKEEKFGTIKGVLIPNILQMIGVILFLRLGWVLGHVGFFAMSIIVTISALLLFITGLSLAAIVSNMQIRAGGAYYLISRTLGIEFGSAIGLLTLISQLCSTSLCVTGFALSIHEFLPFASLPLLKAGTIAALVLISYISTDLALKTQFFIFINLAISIVAIFFNSGPPPETLLPTNAALEQVSFWAAFSVFFPAMTGIESGMSMSGDLKNPSRSLPLGTLGAIGIVYAVYLSIAYFLSNHVSPDLLKSYPFILYSIAKIGPIIIVGIWAATLSSALGTVLGAPRTMQALAKDGILPNFLSRGFGPTNQPRIATLAVFLLATILTLSTDIDQIIPMLTMSCLVSYGLINLIAFFESYIKNPSWRPSLPIPAIVPLVGGIGCFMAMLLINPGATFTVLFFVAILCIWTAKRNMINDWDDLRHGIYSYFVHKGIVKLSNVKQSARSWRPHILTIFDRTSINKNLAFFAHALNQEKSFLTFGASVSAQENSEAVYTNLKEDLKGFKIPSYVHTNQSQNSIEGIRHIIENYGFGFLKPNTVIFSIPTSYDSGAFIQLLLDIHRQEKNIVLLKDEGNKDYLFNDPTRRNKQINLWWRGNNLGNFEFNLALAYLLHQSKLWPRSKIAIMAITKDPDQKVRLEGQFEKYKQKLRIKDLSFEALLDAEEQFFPHLQARSKQADLTFLGLKRPEGATAEEYKEYFHKLMENTAGISNIAYVLSGERVEFRKIFL